MDRMLPPAELVAQLAAEAKLASEQVIIGSPTSTIQLRGLDVARITENDQLNDEVLNAWGLALNKFSRGDCHITSTLFWRLALADFERAEVFLIKNAKARVLSICRFWC